MKYERFFFGVGLAALTIVGSVRCAAQPHDGFACPAFVLAGPFLVVPANGATGVPAAIGSAIVTAPFDGAFKLTTGTVSFDVGPVLRVPSPAPSAIPTGDAIDNLRSVRLSQLSANTTYTLEYTPPYSSAPCGNHEEGGPVGSFTTGSP